ncbi:MAG: Cof-type HAD-IIB family hydrolase [Enterocloster sp.]
MSKYDLIAFDMDGTLLDSDKKIRQDSIDMINTAVNAGKIVSLSTGRCVPELTAYRQQLSSLQYIICLSGAFVFDTKNNREIFSRRLPADTAGRILDEVKNMDVMIHLMSVDSVVQKDKISRMADYHMGIYQSMFEEITVKPEDIYSYYKNNPNPLYKLNLYFRNQQERALIRERLTPLGISLAYAEETSLECSAPHVSKGEGLKKLCEYLQLPVEKTIAVGDADNDLDILRQAGLAVAMGNANENVREIADVIVNDNDHGGCAQAIREYLLP